MRSLATRPLVGLARLRWSAAVALVGLVLFSLTLFGYMWSAWVEIAASGLLFVCAALLNRADVRTNNRSWLGGYLAALADLEPTAPGVVELAEATVTELRSRRPQ